MMEDRILHSVDELAALVHDGARLAVPKDLAEKIGFRNAAAMLRLPVNQ